MSESQQYFVETERIDRLMEFVVGEFDDPLHAALACLTAYVFICETHSGAPDRAAMVRHATDAIMSMKTSRGEPDAMRPQ